MLEFFTQIIDWLRLIFDGIVNAFNMFTSFVSTAFAWVGVTVSFFESIPVIGYVLGFSVLAIFLFIMIDVVRDLL